MQPNRITPPISFARIPCPVALRDLQKDLENLTNPTWVDHVNRRDYDGQWDVLALRCARENQSAHPILQSFGIQDSDAWVDLPALSQLPAILQCVNFLQCPIKSVRLMRLKAGSHIKPHRDKQLSLEFGEARLHLPIISDDKIRFFVHGQQVPMKAGELWYINADQEHEVYNLGENDRINLVIDCSANEWLTHNLLKNNRTEYQGIL